MLEQSSIHFYEKYAQGSPKAAELHAFLTFYFHLSGDAEKCAFYYLHGSIRTNDCMVQTTVETACLDYIIFKQTGSVYGSSCAFLQDDPELNMTKTRSKTMT